MSELANEILVHLSGCKHLELEPKDCSVPEKELKTLQYLAGLMQDIFVECEILFRTKTSTFTSSLVCKDLVTQSLKNITINSNFNDVILSVDIHMKKEFRINLLEHILTLYFRVRAFSFAKDVREKH